MNRFSPILPERAHLFEELFDANYRSRHAAAEPYWSGEEARAFLGLDSRLTYESFNNLLNARTPDGRANLFTRHAHTDPLRPYVWHQLHTAPGSVSVLWAVGPPEIRQLAFDAHSSAVDSDAATKSAWEMGDGHVDEEEDIQHPLFACFPACASRDQTPCLHTHVILVNAAFRSDGRVHPISAKTRRKLEEPYQLYHSKLAMYFRVNFGEFRVEDFGGPNYQIIGVPEELYRPVPPGKVEGRNQPQKPILCADGRAMSVAQMFDCWQQQAAAFGWGSNEVKALARCIQRERACLTHGNRRSHRSASEHREKIQSMTDHLVAQYVKRCQAKREMRARVIGGNSILVNTIPAATPTQPTTARPYEQKHLVTSNQHQPRKCRIKL